MGFLGHLIQVLHVAIALFLLRLSFIPRYSWVGPAFLVVVLVGISIFGDCWMTMLSNECFEQAGHETYKTTLHWMGLID
jgi:hypothetical protein